MLLARRQGRLFLDTYHYVAGPGLYVFSGTNKQIQQRIIGGLLGELYEQSLPSNLKGPGFIFEP